MMEINKTVNPE